MKKYEILPSGKAIRATANTRAGLFTALVQGCFSAKEALAGEDSSEKVERPFSIEARDATELLGRLLENATETAMKHHEVYEDVAFTFITDKKAEGHFVGRPGKPPKACRISGNVDIAKNEEGEWDVTVKVA